MYFVYILLAILILLLMILIHEFGHYIAAKILKFKVVEFAIGFGPKIFKKVRKNGEIFSIRAFPLGGFCAFEGEDEIVSKGTESLSQPLITEPVGEDLKGNKLYAFNAQKPWKRIIVLASGGLFNILSAFFFTFIFLSVAGYAIPKIKTVSEESPNKGIIQVDDIVTAVDGVELDYYNNMSTAFAGKKAGDNVLLTVTRDGKEVNITVVIYESETPKLDGDGNEVLDDDGNVVYEKRNVVGFTYEQLRKGDIGTAFKEFIPVTGEFSWLILGSFGQLITGQVAITDMGGPVSTVKIMADTASANWSAIFLLMPLIAANLGIFNLLPIPALDGSKIIFCTIEAIRKKPVNRNVEAWVHFGGLIALLGFVLIIELINLVFIPLLS